MYRLFVYHPSTRTGKDPYSTEALLYIFFESTELSFCEIYIVNIATTGFEPTTRGL